jgi:maltose/moltooligosaccharide transporter
VQAIEAKPSGWSATLLEIWMTIREMPPAMRQMGLMSLPGITHAGLLFLPMVGVGLGWASLMGNPYAILASAVPPERTGVYMGIFNMFIVIPMLIQMATMPLYYNRWLGGDSRQALALAGALLLAGGLSTLLVKIPAGPASDPVRA